MCSPALFYIIKLNNVNTVSMGNIIKAGYSLIICNTSIWCCGGAMSRWYPTVFCNLQKKTSALGLLLTPCVKYKSDLTWTHLGAWNSTTPPDAGQSSKIQFLFGNQHLCFNWILASKTGLNSSPISVLCINLTIAKLNMEVVYQHSKTVQMRKDWK